MGKEQRKHGQLQGSERHPVALEPGDASADVGDIKVVAGLTGAFVYQDELNQAPETGCGRRRSPSRHQQLHFRELAGKDAINQGNEKKNEEFSDLRAASPGIGAEGVRQHGP